MLGTAAPVEADSVTPAPLVVAEAEPKLKSVEVSVEEEPVDVSEARLELEVKVALEELVVLGSAGPPIMLVKFAPSL